ncbi:MAG: GNAT family N-acetyltransferase [Pseudomonadota bacterium]
MADFHLETERLIIRNWCEEDRGLFYVINSDDRVMEFFPFRRDRAASDHMMDRVRTGIQEKGYGFTAIALRETNEAIGFCGLADVTAEDDFTEEEIEIGWRLASQYWGKGYVTEAAERLLKFGFETLDLDEIVSFAVHNNHRSLAVMQRIGMIRDPERDFDHSVVPDTHPELKHHHVYTITREAYLSREENQQD